MPASCSARCGATPAATCCTSFDRGMGGVARGSGVG
jgi:hypothetical protein